MRRKSTLLFMIFILIIYIGLYCVGLLVFLNLQARFSKYIYQNAVITTRAMERSDLNTSSKTHPSIDNGSNMVFIKATRNRSLSEKYNTHFIRTAYLNFRKRVDGYKYFNANTSILIYEGEPTNHMFKDWKGFKTRPKLSPSMPTFGSCAIIGNSGVLLDSECGREIDEHEFVIRNNMAPISGFENDVGTNTGLMSINSALAVEMTRCLANKTCEPKWKDKLKALGNGTILWYSKVFSPVARQKQYYALSRFIKTYALPLKVSFPSDSLSTTKFWKIKNASSGLMMLSIGTTFCGNVTLYGYYPFSKTKTGRSVPYHYYNNATFKTKHDMNKEHKVLQELNATGVFRLITGKCLYT